VAGVASTVAFTSIHDLFISDIWHTLPIMAVAGALCGLCLAWSYSLLREQPSILGWLGYNLIYVGMLGLLGAASVLITVTVLVLLLGLNVSAIGLVDIPTDSTLLIAEMFGLILALALLNAAVFSVLERQALHGAADRRR
jgi:hypothetical protein